MASTPVQFPQKKRLININHVKIIFIICHIFLALDFGYLNRPTVKAKRFIAFATFVYCLFSSVLSAFVYFLILGEYNWLLPHFLILTVHYFTNALILIVYGFRGSFCRLQKALMCIDLKLHINSESHGVENNIFIICVTFIVSKIVLNYVFCIKHNNECVDSYWGVLIYVIQQLSFDIVLIVSSFMFYCVFCRLKVLNQSVKNSGNQVIYYLSIYKRLVNIQGRAKAYFDVLYTFALLFKMPELVVTTYISLLKIKTGYEYDEAHNHFLRNFYSILVFVVLASPAMTAGLVTAGVDELKLIIHDRLLMERDEDYTSELELFLSYLEAHPMQFTVFQIVPLDWFLPVLILDVCISYQIIMIQITNLY